MERLREERPGLLPPRTGRAESGGAPMTAVVAIMRSLRRASFLLAIGGCKDGPVPPVDTGIHPPELPDCEVLWRVAAGSAWDRFEYPRPLQPLVQAQQIISWVLNGNYLIDVQAVDRTSGEVLWTFSHDNRYRMGGGRFAHGDGRIYVPEWTEANFATLRAISDQSGEVVWAARLGLYEPQELVVDSFGIYGFEQRGDSAWLILIDSTNGSRLAEADLSAYEVVLGPALTDAGVVVFTRRAVLLFAAGTLIPLSEFDRASDLNELIVPLPMASQRRAVFVEGYKHLVALDLGSGEAKEKELGEFDERFGSVVEDLYWATWAYRGDDQGFHSISLVDGAEERYTYDWLPDDSRAVLTASTDRVVRWGDPSGLYVFDANSGDPLCHSNAVGRYGYPLVPIIADGVLYVPGEEELFALRLP